jgi:alpha-ketoglutarate-dependent taurine dioxygenase
MRLKITKINPFGYLVEPAGLNKTIRDVDVEQLRLLFHEEHLIALRGFQTFHGADDFADYCERWGEISVWPFGKVLELIEHENPQDHIFDRNYVPLHWDGMYRLQVPEYQIFHCVKAPLQGQGGRTTFSNTVLALKRASPELISTWKKVTGVYKRKMEFYDSKTVSPIITQHPYKGYAVLRYNEPPSNEKGHFVNPPDLQFTGLPESELESFHRDLKGALYQPGNFYAHEWQTGDIVIADNFTLLHGREEFESKSPRHIRRVHVSSHPPFDNPGLESYR